MLVEFFDLGEAGISFLSFLFGFRHIIQEDPISLIIDLLGSTQRFVAHIAFQCANQIYSVFAHSNK